MAKVSEIWRYPVKSMAGEPLEETGLTDRGLPGDRAWAVRDEVRGGIRGAKRFAALMLQRARYATPPPDEGSAPAEITLADGTTVMTDDANINAIMTEVLGEPVTMWPLVPAEMLDHYRRGAPEHEDMETEWRAVFGRTPDEPLPDLSVFAPEVLEFESPPGTYFDAFPLLIITENALNTYRERCPDSQFEVDRFRPNFVLSEVDSGDPFPELSWQGKRARIGTAVIEFTIGCPRCVMTTRQTTNLPKDPGIMRALVKESGGNFGAYVNVVEPGMVRNGDTFEFVD